MRCIVAASPPGRSKGRAWLIQPKSRGPTTVDSKIKPDVGGRRAYAPPHGGGGPRGGPRGGGAAVPKKIVGRQVVSAAFTKVLEKAPGPARDQAQGAGRPLHAAQHRLRASAAGPASHSARSGGAKATKRRKGQRQRPQTCVDRIMAKALHSPAPAPCRQTWRYNLRHTPGRAMPDAAPAVPFQNRFLSLTPAARSCGLIAIPHPPAGITAENATSKPDLLHRTPFASRASARKNAARVIPARPATNERQRQQPSAWPSIASNRTGRFPAPPAARAKQATPPKSPPTPAVPQATGANCTSHSSSVQAAGTPPAAPRKPRANSWQSAAHTSGAACARRHGIPRREILNHLDIGIQGGRRAQTVPSKRSWLSIALPGTRFFQRATAKGVDLCCHEMPLACCEHPLVELDSLT